MSLPIVRQLFGRVFCLFTLLIVPAHAKVRIVLVGDSTVTEFSGWGLGFREFLTDKVECINTAQGGRSSMSFIKEGRWENALALHGDYYLIQFGHNDEPGKPGRSTELEEYHGYMERYVDEARAQGAIPILITPLVRRQFDKNDPHKINSSLIPRAEIVREIAEKKHVPLVELHDRSRDFCEQLGREGCYAFSPPKEGGKFDGTHLNAHGSVLFAQIVVDELRRVAPDLGNLLRDTPKNKNLSSHESEYDAVVSFDGSGSHTTVQSAIQAAPAHGSKPWRILIKPGTYREHVHISPDQTGIHLIGETGEAKNTIITFDTNVGSLNAGGNKLGTPSSATVLIEGNDFAAQNITFENTTTREQHIQALAMYVTADRAAFDHCRFLGWQDTLRADSPRDGTHSRQYFADCEVTGHVDFIYAAGTAVFDRCRILCKADGYITAASTPQEVRYGFVFLDCEISTGPEVEKGVFLGRPWRPYAATAFLRCQFTGNFRPEGWNNWRNADNELTARYREYANFGSGASTNQRVSWAPQLTSNEADAYTVENILSGSDHWEPRKVQF